MSGDMFGESQGESDRVNLPQLSTVLAGGILGVVAWISGYLTTYVFVAGELRDSPLHRFIEAVEGDPATYEMVGWVFFNAHAVDTVFRNVPIIGGYSTNVIGGEDGFSVLLYLIPIVTLVLAGLAIAWYGNANGPVEGALIGSSVFVGYCAAVVTGIILFRVTLGEASGQPDALAAIWLAGIVYPILLSGLSGAILGFLRQLE